MATRRKSPTVKRRRVAATLRELREKKGIKAAEAAKLVDHDGSWLARIERAEVYCHPNHVRALLTIYDVPSEQAEAVIDVARQARTRGWWHSFRKAMPDWFSTYVGLESEASFIRDFENSFVPGLFQTEDYARALIEASLVKARRSEIDRLVALRMERQAVLTADDPPEVRVVLDEGLLHRKVGGAKIMRAQIMRLVELAEEHPNIKLMVLPYDAGAHAAIDGPFVLLDFPPPPQGYPDVTEPRVVYIESLTGAMYLEQPDEITAYNAAWDGLCSAAQAPMPSRDTLRNIAEDLT